MYCTQSKLEEFSQKIFVFTTIFGDISVRESLVGTENTNLRKESKKDIKKGILDIKETDHYLFDEQGENEWSHTKHHVLISKSHGKKDEICSVRLGYQLLNLNAQDTLCQTYSLLAITGNLPNTGQFGKRDNIWPKKKARNPEENKNLQYRMIQFYRNVLNNVDFKQEMEEIISLDNRQLWLNNLLSDEMTKSREKSKQEIRKIEALKRLKRKRRHRMTITSREQKRRLLERQKEKRAVYMDEIARA